MCKNFIFLIFAVYMFNPVLAYTHENLNDRIMYRRAGMTNRYDTFGQMNSKFRTNGSFVTEYNQYGQKTVIYKVHPSGNFSTRTIRRR